MVQYVTYANFTNRDGERDTVTVSSKEIGRVVPLAISRAALHTKIVAKRANQKSSRTERVSHFITDLRREIGYLRQQNIPDAMIASLQEVLCQKSVWYDIAELESSCYIKTFAREEVSGWVNQARMMSFGLNEQCMVIEGDMESLKSDLGQIKDVNLRMNHINEEAEELVSNFVNLLED